MERFDSGLVEIMASDNYDPDRDAWRWLREDDPTPVDNRCIICDDEIPGEHQHILMDIIHSTDEELVKELKEHRPEFLKQYTDLLVDAEKLLRTQDNGALHCRWCSGGKNHEERCWWKWNSQQIYELKERIKTLLNK